MKLSLQRLFFCVKSKQTNIYVHTRRHILFTRFAQEVFASVRRDKFRIDKTDFLQMQMYPSCVNMNEFCHSINKNNNFIRIHTYISLVVKH